MVTGTNLVPMPRVLLGVPVKSQQVVGQPTATRATIDISLDGKVRSGVTHLRWVSGHGVSTPQVITVDRLPQRPHSENLKIDSLPVAVHGRLAGAQEARLEFSGRGGQQIVIDVLARRLGSTLRPVLHLRRPGGRRIGLGMPRVDLGGDTRLVTTLPEDGVYSLSCHDLQYAGGNPGDFRVSIGQFDAADLVFPSAVTAGRSTRLTLLGTGDQEHVTTVALPGGTHGLVPVGWAARSLPIGLQPRVMSSRWPEIVEAEATPRELKSVPSAGHGRLQTAAEQDSWTVAVKPGEKLRWEVFADRIGSPLDSVLEIKKTDGGVLASNDDTVRSDSRVDFTVPAGVKQVMAVVKDRHGRGGSRFVYRLVVTRTTDPAPADFDLIVDTNSYNVLPGGRHVFRIDAVRRGYAGEIKLETSEMPQAFSLRAPVIPAGAPGALVTVVGPAGVAGDGVIAAAAFGLVGVGRTSDGVIRRTVRASSHPLSTTQPWLREDLVVGHVNSEASPVLVDLKPADGATLWQGQEVAVPVTLQSLPQAIGPIRLSVVTSQKTPLVKGKPNAAAALRGTAATVDVPVPGVVKKAQQRAKAASDALAALEKKAATGGEPDAAVKQQITKARADLETAERALGEAVAKTPRSAVYKVSVPAGLPLSSYDLAIVAELRSADNKTALARSFSPVVRLAARPSLGLAPLADPVVRGTRTPKSDATVRLRGEFLAYGSFGGDVTVTVAGLPKGVPVPKLVIKPGQPRFELPLKIPGKVTANRLDNLQLVVSGAPNPKTLKVQVSARQAFRLEWTDIESPDPPAPPRARILTR